MSETYRGSCLCGSVAFEVDGVFGRAGHCHCSMCRKFHGAAYATIVGVDRSAFHWISGEDMLLDYRAPNGTVRSFCSHCGSSMFFSSPKASPDVVEIALAAFDGNVPAVPDAHIFVEFAANWTKVCDGLPQHSEGRASPTIDAR